MLLKYRCCSNADLCKAFAAVQKGWLVTWRTYFFLLWLVTYFLGEISLLSRVMPQCNTWLCVHGTCLHGSSCCRSKESKLVPWHLFQTISARPAGSVAAPPACWVTNKGATTSWQVPNEGRKEKHPRHHKQLSSSGSALLMAQMCL